MTTELLFDRIDEQQFESMDLALRGPRAKEAMRVEPRVQAAVGYRRRPSRATFVRRRLGVVAALVLLVATLLALFAPDSGAAPSGAAETVIVVVGPGDTVLDAVRPYVPEGEDPRVHAALALAESGLDARAVRPGAVLRLPRP